VPNESGYLRVKNWERYQVYHDDRPSKFFYVQAISDPKKNRVGILDDPTFLRLANDKKCPVFRLMAFAARTGNKIPNDPEYLQKALFCDSPPDIQKMVDAGFLEAHPESSRFLVRKPTALYIEEKRREEISEANASSSATEKVVKEIYDHWRTVRSKTDRRYAKRIAPERRSKIKARLREFSADELKRALDCVALDPWEERPRHDDLTVLFRNQTQVEKFLALGEDASVLSPEERRKRHLESLRSEGKV
jgi:hypothetical protein